MPFTTLPETARVVATFARDQRQFQNVYHARRAGGWSLVQLADLANTFVTWWDTDAKANFPQVVNLVEVVATDVSVENGQQYTAPVAPPIPGTLVTEAAPANSTLVISWRSGFTGRRNRGRSYVPSLADGEVSTGDTVSPGRVLGFANMAAGLLADVLALGARLVVGSYTYGTTVDIISAIVENIVDSQRRRLPGRGR